MPFCENCGYKLSETSKFCSNCGQKVKELEESFLHENSYENQVPNNSNSLNSTEKDLIEDKNFMNQSHEDNESILKDLSRPLMEETPNGLHSVTNELKHYFGHLSEDQNIFLFERISKNEVTVFLSNLRESLNYSIDINSLSLLIYYVTGKTFGWEGFLIAFNNDTDDLLLFVNLKRLAIIKFSDITSISYTEDGKLTIDIIINGGTHGQLSQLTFSKIDKEKLTFSKIDRNVLEALRNFISKYSKTKNENIKKIIDKTDEPIKKLRDGAGIR
jgi:hypothetical protein